MPRTKPNIIRERTAIMCAPNSQYTQDTPPSGIRSPRLPGGGLPGNPLWVNRVRRDLRDRVFARDRVYPPRPFYGRRYSGQRDRCRTSRDVNWNVSLLAICQDQFGGTGAVSVSDSPPVLRDWVVSRIGEPLMRREAVVETQ